MSLTLFLVIVLNVSQAFRILLVGPSFFASHQMQLQFIGDELAKRGHQVYSVVTSKDMMKNKTSSAITILSYKASVIKDEGLAQISNNLEKWLMEQSVDKQELPIGDGLSKLAMLECKAMLESETFLSELKSFNFDLAIVDRFEIAPCFYLLPYLLKIPYVSVSAMYTVHYTSLPSTVLVAFLPIDPTLTFAQRLLNAALGVVFKIMTLPELGFVDHSLLSRHAPQLHSYGDLRDAAHISFVTTDHVLSWPRPAMPNVILVGAVTMLPAKKLPESFKRLADSSTKHGLIIVSFGSMGDYLPSVIVKKMFAALAHFEQTVIFRLGVDTAIDVENVPPNVHLFSWIPQNDLLAHSNTKLFITHCGNNGQYEAVYHGIPMIGFPLFGDQTFNAFRIQRRKYGLTLDISNFSVDEFIESVKMVLNNDDFAKNIRRASAILHDSVASPRETIAYWIEHVLKNGHEHLLSQSMDLVWYQYYSCDVIAFLITVTSAVLYLTYAVLHFFVQRLLNK